ncbi:MAG: Ig-like domain-containing protein [Cognatishimia sp.]
MSYLSYAVRGADGVVVRGQTADFDQKVVSVRSSTDVSLNLSPADIVSYKQNGNDLLIELANGELVTLQDYFAGEMASERELFLSKDGEFHTVDLGATIDNQFIANYEPVDLSGKWSQFDELTFLDLERIEPVVAPLAAPLLGGFGAAGAAVAGAAVIAGGAGGGSGGGSGPIIPTVDDVDEDRLVGGTGPDNVVVTGTGEAGSTVTVTVGDSVETTTVGDDGTWSAEFDSSELPGDGDYASSVVVVAPDGTEHTLTGPNVDIDTTPPAIDVTGGTLSVGETVNAEEQADGHTISGTGEAGASLSVTIDGVTHSTTVGDDGSWSVNFEAGEIATGEYQSEISITSTDARGNSVTVTDTLSVDTVAPAIDLGTVAGDDVINASEAAETVVLSGNGEPGANLSIAFQGGTYDTTVGSDGTWSFDIDSSAIASGTYSSEITLTATDAAGNVTTQAYTVQVDTDGAVSLTTPIEGDNVVNESELSDGVTLTGMAEAGSSVAVTLQGVTKTVTADGNGNWSAEYSTAEIPAGEYDASVSITATDAAGNVTSTSGTLRVDTTTSVGIDNGQAGGDDIANAAEVSSGISLTGTAEAGSTVQVTLQGVTKTVQAGSDGTWSADYAYADIPQGEYDAAISVTSTDAAGNTATSTSTLRVDTELGVAIDANQVGGDDIASAEEVANSLTLTGTADAGSVVQVSLHGVTKTVTAAGDGTWSATYASTEIPQGEYDAELTATVTDVAGNTATSSSSIRVDTQTSTSIAVQQASIDGVVNAAEIQSGVVLDGSAEAGAAIRVEVEGVVRETTADASGYWSVLFEEGTLPGGTYTATANVTATDLAGNTATSSNDFGIDTEVTNSIVTSVTFTGDDVSSVSIETEAQDYSVSALNADGSTTSLNTTEVSLGGNESLFVLNPKASDGTHLVVSTEDAAGNESDTMIVLDDNTTNAGTLDHAGVANFQIEAIELDYASDTSLVLTEEQIRELSDTSDSLTIHGGADDQVTIAGATNTGETREIDGDNYDVYTIGDDGVTLVIDQDINVVI